MQRRSEIAGGVSYTVSGTGFAVGAWIADHWLQVLSALVMLITWGTQLYFSIRADRREERAARKREEQE